MQDSCNEANDASSVTRLVSDQSVKWWEVRDFLSSMQRLPAYSFYYKEKLMTNMFGQGCCLLDHHVVWCVVKLNAREKKATGKAFILTQQIRCTYNNTFQTCHHAHRTYEGALDCVSTENRKAYVG